MSGISEQKKIEYTNYIGMQVYLISASGHMRSLWLPEPPAGKYPLDDGETEQNKSVFVEARQGRWYLCSTSYTQIFDESRNNVDAVMLFNRCKFYIRYADTTCVFYAEQVTPQSAVFHNYRFGGNGRISIGRDKTNDLVYTNDTVSSFHAVLERAKDGMVIRDTDSLNGVFVNGERVKERRLHVGDTVFIMGLKIMVGIDFVSVNDGDGRVSISSDSLVPLDGSENEDYFPDNRGEAPLFNRLPRKKKVFESETITIEGPPLSMNSSHAPLMLRMGSSMVMGGSALMRGNYTSVLSMLVFPLMNHLYSDKDKKEYEKLRCEKYTEYLKNKKKEIQEEKLREEKVLNEIYPPLGVVITYPMEKKQLWERGNREDDFLCLRVGHGQLPLYAPVDYPEEKFELDEDPMEKEMQLLAREKIMLENVPILLPLKEIFISSVVGRKKGKAEFLLRLILQIVFLHSYDEVKIVLLLDEWIAGQLPEVRFLPHIWNDERNFRFLASDLSSGYLVGEYLNKQLEKELAKPRELKEILKDRPYYVVFAWNKSIFDSMEILKGVMKAEKNPGISIVTFFEEVPQNTHEIMCLHSRAANEVIYLKETENRGDAFFMDEMNYEFTLKMMHVVSNTSLKVIRNGYALPKMITFLELFGVGRVEHLNPLKRWRENNPVKSLAVPVGISTDGTSFFLDLHEKYQGPHGLVAGMTGSGKSEFIITFILSLAINFHPDEVAFVLIDYKGGGLAGAFEDEERGIHLPHLVGTITNLDGSAIQRSLLSIESELKRRQRIFNEAKSAANEGTMDIYTYQKLYRSGKAKTPLPHLFIISDEFAELKSQEPEFMDQLISAARIGRSLGVHLILATQKPSGVVNDQINSNVKFRVCLKVQSRSDSDEMLRRPDAAELRDTGRFYLMVGYNEYFALGQSAWCGAPYEPQEEAVIHRDDYIQFVDDAGQNIVQVRPAKEKKDVGVSQLVAIVRYLSDIAKKEQIAVRKLWMNPLPPDISVQELTAKMALTDTVSTVIGMVDDPENQKQYPYVFDFQKCKNFLVIGGNQSGKTTLLQTMLYTLINTYTPEDVNYYILDYSSKLFRVFDNIPYCGGVWGEGEEQQVENFFRLLKEIIQERKAAFLEAEVNSFEAYREIEKIPLILVVIDNMTGLSSWKGGQAIYYDLNLLIREANSVGIKFLVSAGNLDDILYKIKKELETRFVLDAKNRFEYGDILGVRCRYEPPKMPGRGLMREEDRPLECQIARFSSDGTEQKRMQRLKEEVKRIGQKHSSAKQAKRIRQISETERYEEFCEDVPLNRIPLGYSMPEMKKISMPLKQLYCMSLYFGNTSGISLVLGNYLYAAQRDGMHVIVMKRSRSSVFDTHRLQEKIRDNPNITLLQSTAEDCTKLWKELYKLIQERKEVRNEYCEANDLPRTGSETMKQCFGYMQSKTYPLLVIFESFRDFCDSTDDMAVSVMEKIFCDGKGYNYYFLGCYYPDDASVLSVKSLHTAFQAEGFALLYGGQFHRQGLISLPMEYRNVTKPSKTNGACLMQYRGERYPLQMPCGSEEDITADPDEADIISI